PTPASHTVHFHYSALAQCDAMCKLATNTAGSTCYSDDLTSIGSVSVSIFSASLPISSPASKTVKSHPSSSASSLTASTKATKYGESCVLIAKPTLNFSEPPSPSASESEPPQAAKAKTRTNNKLTILNLFFICLPPFILHYIVL